MEIIKWLHEEHRVGLTEDLASRAGFYGYLNLLQWLHANGCTIGTMTAEAAATAGKVFVLEWIVQVCHVPLSSHMFNDPADYLVPQLTCKY